MAMNGDRVEEIFNEASNNFKGVIEISSIVAETGNEIVEALKRGNKILICGNGGSAAQAQHFSGELLHLFDKSRKALPALALNAEQSCLTAAANDDGYGTTFSRPLEALGKEGDVLIGLTTSGNSSNIINALRRAKEMGIKTICLNGKGGGKMNELEIDYNIIVSSEVTARIQEAHLLVIHTWCTLIDDEFA